MAGVRRETATATARAELRDAVVETVEGMEDLASAAISPARPVRRGAPATVFGAATLGVPERRSRVVARLEARAARAAGLAAGLGNLGWAVAIVGAAVVLSRVDTLPREWAAALLLGMVALAEPVAGMPDAAVARRRAAAARDRLAALAAGPAGPERQPVPPPGSTAYQHSDRRPGRDSDRDSDRGFDRGLDVRVRGLVAGWDPAREPVLAGIDLDLPAGARVAVLGVSGGGKSTLAAVLAGLLEPRAGSVTIGGADVRTLPDEVVRRRIGLVSDDADHIFATTVRENLRLARPGADDATLESVLARVGLGGWPHGLGTWLGAGGTTMSGGQRRRFATARALLADPALLILDEPTEGLDEPGAEALMADLLAAGDGRTVLVLTHRTDGLDLVDRTHVLRDGRIRTPARTADRRTSASN